MRSLTQFFSNPRGRATHGVEPMADVRIRRRSLATAAATLLALSSMVIAPAVIAKDRHDDGHWVGTWSASPQAIATPIQINGQTLRQIVHTLEGAPGHTLPEEYFLSLMEEHFDEDEAQEQLDTAINWGRYAELFTFQDDRGVFRLEEPEPAETT